MFRRIKRAAPPARDGDWCKCLHKVLYIGASLTVVCVVATTLMAVLMGVELPPPDCNELGCVATPRQLCRLVEVNHSGLVTCGKHSSYCSQPHFGVSITTSGNRPGVFYPRQRCKDEHASNVVPTCWTQALVIGEIVPCWPVASGFGDSSNSSLGILFYRALDWDGKYSTLEPPVNLRLIALILVAVFTGWGGLTLCITFCAIPALCDDSDNDDDIVVDSSSSSDTSMDVVVSRPPPIDPVVSSGPSVEEEVMRRHEQQQLQRLGGRPLSSHNPFDVVVDGIPLDQHTMDGGGGSIWGASTAAPPQYAWGGGITMSPPTQRTGGVTSPDSN